MKKAKIMNFDSSSGRGNLIVEDGSKIEFETNMWVDFHNLPEAGMEVEVIEDDKNVISLKQFSEQDIQDSLETKDNNENKIIRTTIIASKEEYEQAIKEVNEFQKKLKEELILEKPFEFALALKEYHSNNGYECLDEYINENQANYELALPDESSNIFINYQSSQNIDNKGTFSYKKDGVEIPLTFELFENTSLFINTHIETSCLEYNSDTELFENFILEFSDMYHIESFTLTYDKRELKLLHHANESYNCLVSLNHRKISVNIEKLNYELTYENFEVKSLKKDILQRLIHGENFSKETFKNIIQTYASMNNYEITLMTDLTQQGTKIA